MTVKDVLNTTLVTGGWFIVIKSIDDNSVFLNNYFEDLSLKNDSNDNTLWLSVTLYIVNVEDQRITIYV